MWTREPTKANLTAEMIMAMSSINRAKKQCVEDAGLTKNQATLVADLLASDISIKDYAESKRVTEVSVHSTLRRIEEKCSGFRDRLNALRQRGSMKITPMGRLSAKDLTAKDKENLDGMFTNGNA
jgi:predicted DNA-binding protein YlxM (UPF0122 family)